MRLAWVFRVAGCPQRHTLTPKDRKRGPKRHTITPLDNANQGLTGVEMDDRDV